MSEIPDRALECRPEAALLGISSTTAQLLDAVPISSIQTTETARVLFLDASQVVRCLATGVHVFDSFFGTQRGIHFLELAGSQGVCHYRLH